MVANGDYTLIGFLSSVAGTKLKIFNPAPATG